MGCQRDGQCVEADQELSAALAEVGRLVDHVAGLEHALTMRERQLEVRAATIRRLRAHHFSPRRMRNRRLARRLALIRHPVEFARRVRRRLERKRLHRVSDRSLRNS